MIWISWLWEYALPFVAVLGSVVLFHEFGHYLCAKAFGITVEVFSIGFGKKIVSFVRRGPSTASPGSRSAVTSS